MSRIDNFTSDNNTHNNTHNNKHIKVRETMDPFVNQDVTMIVNHPVVREETIGVEVEVVDSDPTHVEVEEDLDLIHVEEVEEGLGLTHVVAVEEAGMNAAEVVQEDMTVMLPAEGLMVTLVDGGVVAPLEVLEVMAWGQDLEEEEEEGNALV